MSNNKSPILNEIVIEDKYFSFIEKLSDVVKDFRKSKMRVFKRKRKISKLLQSE